jgi:hypothetical protein
MKTPKVTRPIFPAGYVDRPSAYLTWDWVAGQLTESKHYWLCSVRPDGRPHVVPRWCVYLDGQNLLRRQPETRHARNIEGNPNVSLAFRKRNGSRHSRRYIRSCRENHHLNWERRSRQAYKKYKEMGYSPKPNSWDEGGLFVFTPRQCIAWSNFTKDPTKFVFETEE